MAKGKRGQNEGSIFQRADGKWVGAVNLGIQNGKLKRKCKVADTRKEVSDWLVPELARVKAGVVVTTTRQTVGQFLERWLIDCKGPTLKIGTYNSYDDQLVKHVIPALGGLQLSKLTAQHFQKYMSDKLEAGLSPQTVRYHRVIVSGALKQAGIWGLVTRNAAADCPPPRAVKREVTPMEPEQARAFLRIIKGHRLEALFTVAIDRGMRCGEFLGLRWDDVKFEARTIRVAQTLSRQRNKRVAGEKRKSYLVTSEPKTKTSARVLDVSDGLLAVLREHKTRQLEERLKAGDKWADSGLVFTTRLGTAIDPRNVKRQLDKLLDDAGLSHSRIHDLRHFSASLGDAAGESLKEISERLGHSSIRVTGDIYASVLGSKRRESADRMGQLLFNHG